MLTLLTIENHDASRQTEARTAGNSILSLPYTAARVSYGTD